MAGRLLFVTERFAPDIGGVARSSARIAAALAAGRGPEASAAAAGDVDGGDGGDSGDLGDSGGWDVDVLAWTRTLAPGAMTSERVTLPTGSITLHRLGLFGSWDSSMQHTLNVLDWLHQRAHYRAVWGHYVFPAGFMAVWFAALHGLASIVSARGNDIDRLMFPPGDFARLRWTLERAQVVTAVSRDLARKIDLLLGQPGRAVAIPNAVDGDVFSPGEPEVALREALGIQADECVLGFSGELRHKKGTPFLLAALSEVRRQRPACLLIIGAVRARDEAQLASYRAANPDDAARIIITGHLDDPAEVCRYLRLCDLLLMPSLWDGMPNAVLEAMACERVVLASDAGGIPEMIRAGQDGYLVPRANLHRLGQAALELLALPSAERRALGAAARARVLDGFAPARERAALADIIGQLDV
ncbi:MAG: glycosyltransferase family 4 protein [Haliangiales bacterium]